MRVYVNRLHTYTITVKYCIIFEVLRTQAQDCDALIQLSTIDTL